MHSASFFYLWIYSTKIKSFICGRVKLPDVTELIFYFYLLLNILKVKDTVVPWHTVYYLNYM